jgi:hypothetical protein
MHIRKEIAIAILVVLITIIIVAIMEVVAKQPLSNDDLKQQLTNLESFSTETLLILDQYSQDKLSFIYVKNQVEQIDKSVNDFYSLIESKPIPDVQQKNVDAIEKLVAQYAMQLKQIESTNGDKGKLTEIHQIVEQLHQQFTESENQYG